MSGTRVFLSALVDEREVRIDAAQVRAVIVAPTVTAMPGASPSLRGLFAWRERVVPLVSLAPQRRGGVAVVLEGPGELVAVELEAVVGLCEEPGEADLDVGAAKALVQLAAATNKVNP